jgi:hypothetical protein
MLLLLLPCTTKALIVVLHGALDQYRMANETPTDAEYPAPLLLELPNPCLQAVLQHCGNDQRSLCSAARAHSRLHQAVLMLPHLTAVVKQQQQLGGVYSYIDKHGRHLDSVSLYGVSLYFDALVSLRKLPARLQLSRLQLASLNLQMGPVSPARQASVPPCGVLSSTGMAALKQLRLNNCKLIDGWEGLAALPTGLEHLSIVGVLPARVAYTQPTLHNVDGVAGFPTAILQQLQHLTYLELGRMFLQGPDSGSLTLQPLQALTRLADLRIDEDAAGLINASMLSSACFLTHLELQSCSVEPGALAGKTRLQHMDLSECTWEGGAGALAPMLSYMQHMQQLTHLCLEDSLTAVDDTNPRPAAFSALTVSSKLQHLNVRYCTLPTGVWPHIFPIGRRLPHLRSLDISLLHQPSGGRAAAPEGSRLVSCCPGLQQLDMQGIDYQYDSGRHSGQIMPDTGVCLLTDLRQLNLSAADTAAGLLLQLTQLQHLTRLEYLGPKSDGARTRSIFDAAYFSEVGCAGVC